MDTSIYNNWLIAENLRGDKIYLIRKNEPRFIAEISEGDQKLADGFTFDLGDGEFLTSFEWIDSMPTSPVIDKLLEEARNALVLYDKMFEMNGNSAPKEDDFEEPSHTEFRSND